MTRIRQIATSEMKWQDATNNPYLKQLWKGLRGGTLYVVAKSLSIID